jgi:glycosyltransferase involved in cell wall biosynthesis
MAGPGIRAFEIARRLAERFDVTLSVPFATDLPAQRFPVVVSDPADHASLTELVSSGFDAVFAQRLPLQAMSRLAGTSVTRVYDLYAPISIEMVASLAAEPGHVPDTQLVRGESMAMDAVLETGSSFVCASETQRDYWLGRLEAAGRLTLEAYSADPSLRALIEVVPFGVPSEPPRPGRALKGVVDGISERDRVILWNGGIWNWFDPVTVIRGVAELSRQRDDVRLVFMGTTHPNPTIAQRARANEAVSCASELDVLDRIVFFNEGWVPYEQRGAYLLEADVGVSAHSETLESRLAFRTRILDCLWAELPVVVTEGDALANIVEQRGLGRTVPVGDPSAWAAALAALLDDRAAYEKARRAMAVERRRFEWDALVERLVPLLERPGRPLPMRWRVRRTLDQFRLRALASYRYRGARGFVRRAAWHARRTAGRARSESG